MATPIVPVSSAVTAAMIAALVSVRVSTKRMPLRSAASMMSRLQSPPGTPNMRLTPRAARRRAIASATVMVSGSVIVGAPSPEGGNRRSLDADPGFLDHDGPARDLAPDEAAERL